MSACRASMATVPSLLDAAVAARGAKEAFVASQQHVAWDNAELMTHVDAVARGLVELGYKKGSKLAVWMTNEAENLCVQYAAVKAGVIVLSLDPVLSAEAVGKVLQEENCRGLVYSDRFEGQLRTESVQKLLPEMGSGSWGDTVSSKRFRSLRHVVTTSFDPAAGVTQYAEFPVYGTTDDFLPEVSAAVADDDVAIVTYTVGPDADTPVLVKSHTHAQLAEAADVQVKEMALSAADTLVVTAPLSGAGFTAALAGAVTGAKVVLPTREFNHETAEEVLSTVQATALAGAADHIGMIPAAHDLKTAAL